MLILSGPIAVGKTTLVRQIAGERDADYLTLGDRAARELGTAPECQFRCRLRGWFAFRVLFFGSLALRTA